MQKNIILSLCAAVVIIGSAVLVKNQSHTALPLPDKSVSTSELKEQSGKLGKKCWVAVDGTVYAIEQGFKWINGVHISSKGQAYCGMDLSKVIDKAPHGRSKLYELNKVGTLKN